MTIKKNVHANYTSFMQIPISWSQVITSLVIGAVVGAIGILRLSDSQQIVIAGQGREIDELKEIVVPRGEYEQSMLRIDEHLQSLDTNYQSIDQKLTRLLER